MGDKFAVEKIAPSLHKPMCEVGYMKMNASMMKVLLCIAAAVFFCKIHGVLGITSNASVYAQQTRAATLLVYLLPRGLRTCSLCN